MKKGLDERIDKGMLWRFGNMERLESDRIAERIYVRKNGGSHSVRRPQKKWIDTMKECLRKRVLDIRQPKRMLQEKCEWQGFVRGNAWGVAQGMNP